VTKDSDEAQKNYSIKQLVDDAFLFGPPVVVPGHKKVRQLFISAFVTDAKSNLAENDAAVSQHACPANLFPSPQPDYRREIGSWPEVYQLFSTSFCCPSAFHSCRKYCCSILVSQALHESHSG
jgi:hypothetical protein